GLVALQMQVARTGLGPGAVTPGAPPPGVTIPPATLALPSPWLPALPWIGAALLAVGTLFILSPRNPRLPLAGLALSAILLTSFVPPFSGLPNPAGLIWRIAGGYHYDPRLPFRNEFVIADEPDQLLQPYLDGL